MPWVNWVPQQPPVTASQMLQLLRLPAGAATSQVTTPRTGKLRAFLPILGQLGPRFECPPLSGRHPQREGRGGLRGRGKPGNLRMGSPSSTEASEPKGCRAGQGRRREERRDPAFSCSNLPLLMVGQGGTARRRDSKHRWRHSTSSQPQTGRPNESPGAEPHFKPLNHFPEFGDPW